ncbi:MAG: hypothetical protein WA326_07960 [Nitrososphaeraceae archaeon]
MPRYSCGIYGLRTPETCSNRGINTGSTGSPPLVEHAKCPIKYYKRNGMMMELCISILRWLRASFDSA